MSGPWWYTSAAKRSSLPFASSKALIMLWKYQVAAYTLEIDNTVGLTLACYRLNALCSATLQQVQNLQNLPRPRVLASWRGQGAQDHLGGDRFHRFAHLRQAIVGVMATALPRSSRLRQ